ncbi:MAG: ABC transporter permease [Bermanella sp.]
MIQTIPFLNLAIAFIPVMVGLFILLKWSLHTGNAVYALSRMLIQLLLIGYLLTYIFSSDSAFLVLAVLLVMVFSSSWIALGTIKAQRKTLFLYALLAISVGGGLTLVLISQGVLALDPWYTPQYLIPLAGMIFANSMNSVSLAGERIQAEMSRGVSYEAARKIALQAALIPVINSLFAVGLVSLPGMMTGQILSGISPLIAVRYQIMVMCMIFSSSIISGATFLVLIKPMLLNKKLQG